MSFDVRVTGPAVPSIMENFVNSQILGYGGFLSHRGTPSHHPFLGGIFPNKNHPFWGSPIYGNPLKNPQTKDTTKMYPPSISVKSISSFVMTVVQCASRSMFQVSPKRGFFFSMDWLKLKGKSYPGFSMGFCRGNPRGFPVRIFATNPLIFSTPGILVLPVALRGLEWPCVPHAKLANREGRSTEMLETTMISINIHIYIYSIVKSWDYSCNIGIWN